MPSSAAENGSETPSAVAQASAARSARCWNPASVMSQARSMLGAWSANEPLRPRSPFDGFPLPLRGRRAARSHGRRVLGNPPAESRTYLRRWRRTRRLQPAHGIVDPRAVARHLGLHDPQLRVRRGERALVVGEQFLVELLAGPQPGEDDLDVTL